MTIKEVYTSAIKYEQKWLSILIEFLVFDREVVQFKDKWDVLDLYFKPNNKVRMNQLLRAYEKTLRR